MPQPSSSARQPRLVGHCRRTQRSATEVSLSPEGPQQSINLFIFKSDEGGRERQSVAPHPGEPLHGVGGRIEGRALAAVVLPRCLGEALDAGHRGALCRHSRSGPVNHFTLITNAT